MAEAAGLPFVHVAVTPETKPAAELVVLARYMQVLSDDACKALDGRAITIHHTHDPHALPTVGRDAEALAPSR